ncbi:MAG: hypothetical protein OJF51_003819 [Nitrospira sp.]|nr:MAG: hypothetical protein OJF51_003819 [Nitrospira sp.]
MASSTRSKQHEASGSAHDQNTHIRSCITSGRKCIAALTG